MKTAVKKSSVMMNEENVRDFYGNLVDKMDENTAWAFTDVIDNIAEKFEDANCTMIQISILCLGLWDAWTSDYYKKGKVSLVIFCNKLFPHLEVAYNNPEYGVNNEISMEKIVHITNAIIEENPKFYNDVMAC